jgi:hypothetical protein
MAYLPLASRPRIPPASHNPPNQAKKKSKFSATSKNKRMSSIISLYFSTSMFSHSDSRALTATGNKERIKSQLDPSGLFHFLCRL